jgi:hypothetical protein
LVSVFFEEFCKIVVAFVDSEGRLFGGTFPYRVYGYLFWELFAHNVPVPASVKVKRQQLNRLPMLNKSFNYVVANSFAATVYVKVGVHYKEGCHEFSAFKLFTFPFSGLRSFATRQL